MDSFIHEQWLKLVQDAKKVGVVEVRRHYHLGLSSGDLRSIQLHGFADASEKAYGAVVYLRLETTTGTVFTQLVSSKTRVAPINGETIPRLELLGALVLGRLEFLLDLFAALFWPPFERKMKLPVELLGIRIL